MTEQQLQSKCFTRLWNEQPQTRGCFFAITNNSEHVGRAMQRKAMGLVAGVADTCFIWDGKTYFLEFKTETGRQSEKQKWWQSVCEQHSIQYIIIRTEEQFFNFIDKVIHF